MVSLYDHQRSALEKMKNGCILCGGVGSGKSRTALAYYYLQQGGNLDIPDAPMKNPLDIYIITTARKRDTCEWENELAPFLLSTHEDCNYYKNKVVIDSWNNIGKYKDVKNSFFIFDEQRVVGYGAWTKAFLKIAKVNKWILLSATPGDTWQDYIPVFIANGFYRNKTDFIDQHVVYDWRSKYPKVDRYLNTGRLIRLRNRILVTMEFERHTTSHHQDVPVSYNIPLYKDISRNRWNPWEDRPIETASELCMNWRRVVNSDESRSVAVLEIMEDHPTRLIDKMYPITLPYFPADKKFKIIVEEFLTDEKNGDFDTVGYLQLILPNGKVVDLNGYFKDGPDGMVRIEQAEYEERKANRIDKK